MAAVTTLTIAETDSNSLLPEEVIDLYVICGWGTAKQYTRDEMLRALEQTTYIVTARDSDGVLHGLVRVLSDGVYYTTITDIIVRPIMRRRGIGKQMMALVGRHYNATGVYIEALPHAEEFFSSCGFRPRLLTTMSMRCTYTEEEHDRNNNA